MGDGAGWVDDICRGLHVDDVSPWLPWARREKSEALGRPREPVAGVFVLGWSAGDADPETIFIGEASDLRMQLRQLEGAVKWRQRHGLQLGFEGLRDLLERRGDHRTMRCVWLKVIRVEEPALFASPLLDRKRLEALGARRRQLHAILVAAYDDRFGVRRAAARERAQAPAARSCPPDGPPERPQQAA